VVWKKRETLRGKNRVGRGRKRNRGRSKSEWPNSEKRTPNDSPKEEKQNDHREDHKGVGRGKTNIFKRSVSSGKRNNGKPGLTGVSKQDCERRKKRTRGGDEQKN